MAPLGQDIDFSGGGSALPCLLLLFDFFSFSHSCSVRIFHLVMDLVRLGIFPSQQEEL